MPIEKATGGDASGAGTQTSSPCLSLRFGGAVGNSLDVYVVDSNGDPVPGTRVSVFVDGELPGGYSIFSGGFLEDDVTDDEGHATFETACDYEDTREIAIYVGGERFGPYEIGGGAFTVNI